MRVISEEKLKESVYKYIDTLLAQQREIRDYWAAQWNTGEGNSTLYAKNMTTAQDCIDFLTMIKRGVTCEGCTVREKAARLERDNYLLQQEIRGFPKEDTPK